MTNNVIQVHVLPAHDVAALESQREITSSGNNTAKRSAIKGPHLTLFTLRFTLTFSLSLLLSPEHFSHRKLTAKQLWRLTYKLNKQTPFAPAKFIFKKIPCYRSWSLFFPDFKKVRMFFELCVYLLLSLNFLIFLLFNEKLFTSGSITGLLTSFFNLFNLSGQSRRNWRP